MVSGVFCILVATMSLTGCSSSPSLSLDTAAMSGRGALLVAAGPLEGEVLDGHACFWVPVDGGAVSLVWPEGSIAKNDPLRVEDPDGHVLIRIGDDPSGLSGHPSDEAGCHQRSQQFLLGPMDPRG